MKKKIWLTSLARSPEAVQGVMASLKAYGLEGEGHFWEDNLDKMAWYAPRAELLEPEVSLWLIHGSAEMFSRPSVRYGLSLLALCIQAVKGVDFPIIILQDGGGDLAAAPLPTALQGSAVLPAAGGAYGAKLVAAVHRTSGQMFPPYRLDVHGVPQVGQWFEVGPREGVWQGAIFGTTGTGVVLHAVGPAGRLPEKTVLNFAQQGLEITLGERRFNAWAVQNPIDQDTSYFVKVDGHPQAVMFCPYSQEDEAQAYIMQLS